MKRKNYDGIYNRIIKRIIDIIVSVFIVSIFLPLYAIISICIVLEDGFPIMYKAYRGGYKGENFKICKFRTMVKNADKIGGGTTALDDPRITKVGSFLRKTKLDEFPQFLQVITGKMSIVGPRPELLQYVKEYKGEEKDILQVRPGITDYSSLKFINLDEIVGGDNADEAYERKVLPEKNKLRIKYAHNVSLKTDTYIFIKTAKKVMDKIVRFVRNKVEW